MRRLFLALTLSLCPLSVFAQTDFSKVDVKAEKVAGSVYMLTGAGGNIGVSVGEDGIVLVDDQYAPLAPKIETALRSITDKPVRFVLNTHYHGDHTGGNEHFGKSAPVVAHENVRRRLNGEAIGPDGKRPPVAKAALPVLTFNDSVTIHLNGEDVRAVHMPHGHTDGDSVIWFTQSNVIHMGDDFFNGAFPFVDIHNGGSVRGLITNIEKLLPQIPADAKVIPGHGTLSNAAGLRSYLDMLKKTLAIVEQGLAAGKTADQLKQEDALADWSSWGTGFIKADRWIDTLVQELGTAERQHGHKH